MQDNVLKWIGGKHTLGEFIIKRMPPHKKYIEVFMGGGNIFLQKPLADNNIINDLNGNLITMYKVINDPIKKEMLKHLFKRCEYSRAMYEYFRTVYRNHIEWFHLEDTVKAFRYIYLNRVSFNGQGQTYARRDDSSVLYNLDSVIDKMYNKIQAGKTVIEKLPFEELLVKVGANNQKYKVYDNKDSFLYLDPPYYITTQTQGKAYYEKVMSISDHTLLRDILFDYKNAKWLLSYDDVPEIRDLYKLPRTGGETNVIASTQSGIYAILTPETHQSAGSNQDEEQTYKRELLIANYNLSVTNTLFEV